MTVFWKQIGEAVTPDGARVAIAFVASGPPDAEGKASSRPLGTLTVPLDVVPALTAPFTPLE